MKNQYFGDNRDLFKYDLIYQIIHAGLVDHFTFIPMLTKNDDSKQGGERNRDKAKAGTENSGLVEFLNEFEDKSKRDVKQLKSFFEEKRIKMTIYKQDEYFSDDNRREYFKQIGNELLSKSLVFVDPDIGLQINRSREEHILYSEVKMLYDRMDRSSVLMIFQFIPRENRETYYPRISKKLEEVGNLPVYISDNQIVFFFLTKDKSIEKSLIEVINDYGKAYPKLKVGKEFFN